MDNEKNKDLQSSESEPQTGKRKVVLGQDDFSMEDQAGRGEAGPVETPGAKKSGGFLNKLFNRDLDEDPADDVGQLTQEANEAFRASNQRYQSPVFDEEKDRLLAEESTKDIPVELLESKVEADNPAARRVEKADTAAVAAERQGLDRRGPLTDRERRDQRVKNRWIGGLIFAAVAALLILFAPSLQELIFKTADDSLIFSPAQGLFGPRAGVISILLGLLGLAIVFSTLFTKRKEESLSKKPVVKKSNPFRTIGLVMLILIPVGFALLFNFTEFRNSDIRYSSLFNQNKLLSYDKVTGQDINASGDDIFYTIKADGTSNTQINITKLKVEAVKLLDNKLPRGRNVTITTVAKDKMIEKQIYTNDEFLRLFINKNEP